jgi:hypothetical protein
MIEDTTLIYRWERSKELMTQYGLKHTVFSQSINVSSSKEFLGSFTNVDALYHFLLGYDWGMNNSPKRRHQK